jgi:DHA1 family bicyclomycin/chloramphenicol resistance-like MFS transporter
MATLAAAMGIAPVIGPIIGGFVGARSGPPGVFAITAVLAFGGTLWMMRSLHETLRRAPAHEVRERWWQGYGELVRSRVFVGYTLLYGFIQGSFFAFLAVGAVIFERDLGLGQDVFGMTWGVLGIAYVAATLAAGRLAPALGTRPILLCGGIAALAAGWTMVLFVALFGVTLAGMILPLLALMVAAGLITPLSLAGAVGGRPGIAGKAAGLSGAVGLVLSGSMSIVAGVVYAGDFLPIAALVAAMTTLAAVMIPLAAARGH